MCKTHSWHFFQAEAFPSKGNPDCQPVLSSLFWRKPAACRKSVCLMVIVFVNKKRKNFKKEEEKSRERGNEKSLLIMRLQNIEQWRGEGKGKEDEEEKEGGDSICVQKKPT